MLSATEIADVADDFRKEAGARDYVRYILAPGFADDPNASQMIVEVMEVVLHRRNLYIVPQSRVKDAPVTCPYEERMAKG